MHAETFQILSHPDTFGSDNAAPRIDPMIACLSGDRRRTSSPALFVPGAAVRRVRLALCLTVQSFAHLLGISKRQALRFERAGHLFRLRASALGAATELDRWIAMEDLAYGEGSARLVTPWGTWVCGVEAARDLAAELLSAGVTVGGPFFNPSPEGKLWQPVSSVNTLGWLSRLR